MNSFGLEYVLHCHGIVYQMGEARTVIQYKALQQGVEGKAELIVYYYKQFI